MPKQPRARGIIQQPLPAIQTPDTALTRFYEEQRGTSELAYVAQWSKQPVVPDEIIGTTGLRHASGFINEEFLSRLRYLPGVQFYSEMWANSAVVGAMMFLIQAMIRQVPWTMTTQGDTPEHERWKEYGESLFVDMDHTWGDLVSEIMSMLVYGWAWFEIVMKLRKGPDGEDQRTISEFDDGLWGIRKIEMRSQDTLWQWGFTRDGELRGIIQLDTWNQLGRGPVFIPVEKSLHFVTRRFKSNPEGQSILRPAVGAYHRVKRLEELEGIGYSKELSGIPDMQVPKELLIPTAGAADKSVLNQIKTMMAQLQVDERAYILRPSEVDANNMPTGFKFGLVSTSGKRSVEIRQAIESYNTQIMQCFLADFMQIGHDKVGTQSLFQGKSDLFLMGLTHFLNIIRDELNRTLMKRLMRLNSVPKDLWPEFDHGKLDKPDLAIVGEFLQRLGAAGILSPNRDLEKAALDLANLPPPDEGDMEIYEDMTRPTPATPQDLAAGLMSERQTKLIMDVNEKVSDKKMSTAVAAKLLAQALGMDPQHAAELITEPSEETQPKLNAPPAVDPRAGGQVSPGVGPDGIRKPAAMPDKTPGLQPHEQ